MAIGDAVAQGTATSTVTRQPASGVEEQITSLSTNGTADAISLINGANSSRILIGSAKGEAEDTTARNCAYMITNASTIQKEGTTDKGYWCGVQTNV